MTRLNSHLQRAHDADAPPPVRSVRAFLSSSPGPARPRARAPMFAVARPTRGETIATGVVATTRAERAIFRCVLYKKFSPIARFQHLIASPFN